MTDGAYIRIADKINELLLENKSTEKIDIPKIVVVGTQSSGKSTLLNNMIGYEVLPTGDNMVTRTPLIVRLHNQSGGEYLTLSIIEDGNLKIKVRLSLSELTTHPERLRTSIDEETIKITGTQYTIADTPLFLDMYGSKLPNLSFVDLPGLITIPKVDKGQPETLPYDIEKLVESQISHENTIVLVVIQSKPDLEIDLGLALVKKLQRKYQSIASIGVLTKPDILDDADKLNKIVAGDISKDVSLDNGYFVVNNKDDSKVAYEKLFQVAKKKSYVIDNNRYGIRNTMLNVQQVLVKKIKEVIPHIKKQIINIVNKKRDRLIQLGAKLSDKADKVKYVNVAIQEFVRKLLSSISSDGHSSVDNVGSRMGYIFDTFEDILNEDDPFRNILDDHYQQIIDSFRGYKFTTEVSITTLMSKCLNDEKIRPIDHIYVRAIDCVYRIISELTTCVKNMLDSLGCFDAYPNLKNFFADNVIGLLKTYEQTTMQEIQKYIDIEKNSIHTTRTVFTTILKDISIGNEIKTPESNGLDITNAKESATFLFGSSDSYNVKRSTSIGYSVHQIKNSSRLYYERVIKPASQRIIIGQIRANIIEKIKNELGMFLTNLLLQSDKLSDDLFVEDKDIEAERTELTSNVNKIENILTLLQTC